jgi:hypothetical protein
MIGGNMTASHRLRIAAFIIAFAGAMPAYAADTGDASRQDSAIAVPSVQDAEKLFPGAVSTRADGTKMVNVPVLTGPVAKVVVDLNARVERLEAEVKALKLKEKAH